MSDDAHDAVVDLFFNALPSMDGEELGALLDGVLAIMEREVRRAKMEQRAWDKRIFLKILEDHRNEQWKRTCSQSNN